MKNAAGHFPGRRAALFSMVTLTAGLSGLAACGARSSLDEGRPGTGGGTTTEVPGTTSTGGGGGAATGTGSATTSTGTGAGGTGGSPGTGGDDRPSQPVSCAPFDWALSIGGEGAQKVVGALAGPAGDTIVVGSFVDHVDFGEGPIDLPGLGMFVIDIGPGGLVQWARVWPHLDPRMIEQPFPPNGWPDGISKWTAMDGAGNVLLAVRFDGPVDLGAGPEGPGERILALDPAGNVVWAIPIGDGAAEVVPQALAVGEGGHLFVAGHFDGALPMGPDLLVSDAGELETFLAELDPAGAPLWGRRFDHSGLSSRARHEWIEPMAGGGVLLSSWVSDTVDFGGGPYSTHCGYSYAGSCQYYETDRVIHRFAPGGSLIPVAEEGPGFGHASFLDGSDVRLLPDGTLVAAWFWGGPPSWRRARFLLDDELSPEDVLWDEKCDGAASTRITVAPAGPDALLFSPFLGDEEGGTCEGIPFSPGEWTFKTDLGGHYLCHVSFGGHAAWAATMQDAAGGIVFAGTFTDTVQVEPGPIEITGESDVVVIRHGPP